MKGLTKKVTTGARILLLAVFVLTMPLLAWAAPHHNLTDGRSNDSDQEVYRKLLDLRSDFIKRIRYEGYSPSLPPPAIEMGDPPTFGNYDVEKNVLYIAIWSRLTAAEKDHFADIAKNLGPKATARGVFEAGTDRWVFTHELGHWWQACQHKTRANSYEEEMGANRIASAFWRERDPGFMQGMVEGFRSVRESIPSPVPQGESKIDFLDTHFEAVSTTDAYTWYQSDMVIDLSVESPLPSFHRALSQPLYPW
jgi:hypothetical protein